MKYRVLHYDTIDSTNHLAKELAERGAREGTVVSAEYQTRGRGRFKRSWKSSRGSGLLFSLILRPKVRSSSASMLTHVAARAVAKALEKGYGLQAKLKAPNDVLVGGRKIAGILTEARARGHEVQHVVVGIGLNVNATGKKLVPKATSIAAEKGRKVEKNEVLKRILKEFSAAYRYERNGHSQ